MLDKTKYAPTPPPEPVITGSGGGVGAYFDLFNMWFLLIIYLRVNSFKASCIFCTSLKKKPI